MTNLEFVSRPGPVPDEDSAAYWEGLAVGQIRLQKCGECGTVRFPPLPCCPACRSDAVETVLGSGTGTVYSWITVRRPLGTITAEEIPCTIATVELTEGPRTVGRLMDVERPVMDMPVEACFRAHDGWTELCFGPVDG
jgi:hypothetical protein